MRAAACALALALALTLAVGAQQPGSAALLQEATAAETSGQLDLALDRLYALQLEFPRTPDALTGRAALARLLLFQGDLSSSLVQAQSLRDDLPGDSPQRQAMLDFTTLVARRLRAKNPSGFYAPPETLVARGLASLDEPTTLFFEPAGSLVLVDEGQNRVFRIAGDSTTTLNVTQEPTAAALVGTTLVVAGKNGPVASPAGLTVPATGTWDGKVRQVRKVRSMAANSKGDLFVVDRDYDGLLRCAAGAPSCATWGPIGKLRAVKTGPSDLVVTLDDRQGVVRVIDPAGKLVTALGPAIGAARLEKAVDIAVDRAYAIYVLDGDLRRVDVAALRTGADGRVSAEWVGAVSVPGEGTRAIKNPSAMAVSPDGTIVVAGRGTSQLLRFR